MNTPTITHLQADVEVTQRAIERVVGSLTGDPTEQTMIISAAALGAITHLKERDEAPEAPWPC